MWAALLAMVVVGHRPLPKPVQPPSTVVRATPVSEAVRPTPEPVLKLDAQEGGGSLDRLKNGLELSGPVVLKPDFQGGPGAAIALKF
jgi:hypothetical protein